MAILFVINVKVKDSLKLETMMEQEYANNAVKIVNNVILKINVKNARTIIV